MIVDCEDYNMNVKVVKMSIPNYKGRRNDVVYPTELRHAGEKGRGVFAIRNINKFELCCFYDGIMFNMGEEHRTTPEKDLSFVSKTMVNVIQTLIGASTSYSQNLGDTTLSDIPCENFPGKEYLNNTIIGFANQMRYGGIAQLCNDWTTTCDVDYRNKNASKNMNVIGVVHKFENKPCLCFVAIRDIKKDEEILHDYGCDYWRSKLDNEEDDLDFEGGIEKMGQDMFGKEYSVKDKYIVDYMKRLKLVKDDLNSRHSSIKEAVFSAITRKTFKDIKKEIPDGDVSDTDILTMMKDVFKEYYGEIGGIEVVGDTIRLWDVKGMDDIMT